MRGRQDLEAAEGSAEQSSRPITATELIHESVGLLHALRAFQATPHLFVLHDRSITAIATRSDIQKPAVTLAALGVIFAVEQGLTEMVRCIAAERWKEHITSGRSDQADSILLERRRFDADIDIYECLQLADLFDVAAKDLQIRDRIGMGKKTLRESRKWVIRARDTMAHAGSLLNAFPDPTEAIERFHDLCGLATQIWSAVPTQDA